MAGVTLATTTDDLRDRLGNVSRFRLADTLTPGTPPDDGLGILEIEAVAFDQTYGRGSDLVTYDLHVLVPTGSPRTTLATLEQLLSDIKDATETIGSPIQVMQAAGFSTYSVNGVEMYGCHVQIVYTTIA